MLCGQEGCRRIRGHTGSHEKYPQEAWSFLQDKDKAKINKAGYATPRGGSKGAYQNHVYRNNKVIIPFERLHQVNLDQFSDDYVIRLFPEQYFLSRGIPKSEFTESDCIVKVGITAFVLYRSHESFEQFPPLDEWSIRHLTKENGQTVSERRGNVRDHGHYLIRLPRSNGREERIEGPPQGIFAPEYADKETNFLCQCILAWLIVHTNGSPYTVTGASHLRMILEDANLLNIEIFERRGILRHGLCCCPLCNKIIKHEELNETISFEDVSGLSNASLQTEGTTRSTTINLFHIVPLVYSELAHTPLNIAWGHAHCNTKLGQRHCYSLNELIDMNLKVGVIREEGIETFGWISENFEMIRSLEGAVWVRIVDSDEAPEYVGLEESKES